MLFMIEQRGNQNRWEAIGTGDGIEIEEAFHDLETYAGKLPAGWYRYLACSDIEARMVSIKVAMDGSILDSTVLR